jgi:hypothetical protein
MPAHPAQASLLGVEAIVFAAKCLAHLIEQALGQGRIGDRISLHQNHVQKYSIGT